MNEDEKKAYSKGYQAGKRRKKRDISRDALARKREAFWQRAFLAALPAALTLQGWVRGNEPITKLEDRMQLAAEVADMAAKHAARNF